MPRIQLPPATATALQLLVRAAGVRRAVEVGTLAGYSAIWIARALPQDGKLVTLEISAKHAAVARRSLEDAGVADKVEVRVGDATRLLDALGPDGSFDLVFVDADKERYGGYLSTPRGCCGPAGCSLPTTPSGRGGCWIPGSTSWRRSSTASTGRWRRIRASTRRSSPVGDGLLVAVRR